MVGFIVLKKESTYICATCRKCMNAMKNYTYHLVAVLTVGIWGLTFISTKVLIGHGLSPQEIFLLRFLIAYMGIWLISPRKLFADNWKDEFWMFLGGMTGGSFYFFTENTALEITLATCRKCMNAMKNYTYHLVAVLTVGIWGLTFISTKVLIGHGLSPQEIFLLRFLIAYMGIWLISPRKLFADNWKDEFWMFLGGMTGGSFYFFTENTALEITLATNVSFIVCTAPLLTTILSLWIYKKEKATRGLIGGSLLALVGVALVVYNGSFVLKISPLGDFLTLLAAFSWAFYSLIMRKMSNRYGITFITRKIFFYGVLTILPAFLVHPWQFDIARLLEPAILFNLLFLGVLASLICFVVWNVILKQLGTIRASNYIYLNPLFTLIGSAFLLGERLTMVALMGAVLILGGVYWAGKR